MERKLVYRICRNCGEKVNVACTERHDKKYVCPVCSGEPWYMTKMYLSTGRRGGRQYGSKHQQSRRT